MTTTYMFNAGICGGPCRQPGFAEDFSCRTSRMGTCSTTLLLRSFLISGNWASANTPPSPKSILRCETVTSPKPSFVFGAWCLVLLWVLSWNRVFCWVRHFCLDAGEPCRLLPRTPMQQRALRAQGEGGCSSQEPLMSWG